MNTLRKDAEHALLLAETAGSDELRQELLDIAADLKREEWLEKKARQYATRPSPGDAR
jgi:hypothetical protein